MSSEQKDALAQKKLLKRSALLSYLQRKGSLLRPRDLLFREQEAYRAEEATVKAAVCTRRAGKTTESAVELIEAAELTKYSMNPYIALTRDSAKRIMWPVLEQMKRKLGLELELTESNLTATNLRTGSQIFCVGADQKNFIERLRGIKIKKAVIDESGSFKQHIESLVDEVLEPACMDLKGQISLIGSPGIRPQGYFYDITTKKRGIPVYRWSLYDNPFLENPRAYVENLQKRKGWSDDNPTLRREWRGEWVLDLDALVYKFKRAKNIYEELPTGIRFHHILGLDFGYSPDPSAFAVLAYSPEVPHVFVVHTEKHLELTPSDIAERTEELIDLYAPTNIVADTGGLGKSIAAEMVKRYGIALKPAEKKEKLANQQLLNGDFIDGKLFVHASLEDLHHQYEVLTYADNGLEDPNLPNDLCDAVLYAWREAQHYAWRPKEAKISRDSNEYMQQYWKAEADKIERENKNESDEYFSVSDGEIV